MMIFKILAAIFVFGIIILVHELGHFLMCKLCLLYTSRCV